MTNEPTSPAATSNAQSSQMNDDKAYLWRYAYIIPILFGLWGMYVYFAKPSDPASQVLGSVVVSAFYIPPPLGALDKMPNFPRSREDLKPDGDSASLYLMNKQYFITVSNRGSKEAKNVRLLMPKGATFFTIADSLTDPGPITFAAESRIELGSLEINADRRVVVWSSEPVGSAEAETVTIAHEGGIWQIKPATLPTLPVWAMSLLWVSAFAVVLGFVSLATIGKRVYESAKELTIRISEEKSLAREMEASLAAIRALQEVTNKDNERARELIDDASKNIAEVKRQSNELKAMTDKTQGLADRAQQTIDQIEKAP